MCAFTVLWTFAAFSLVYNKRREALRDVRAGELAERKSRYIWSESKVEFEVYWVWWHASERKQLSIGGGYIGRRSNSVHCVMSQI